MRWKLMAALTPLGLAMAGLASASASTPTASAVPLFDLDDQIPPDIDLDGTPLLDFDGDGRTDFFESSSGRLKVQSIDGHVLHDEVYPFEFWQPHVWSPQPGGVWLADNSDSIYYLSNGGLATKGTMDDSNTDYYRIEGVLDGDEPSVVAWASTGTYANNNFVRLHHTGGDVIWDSPTLNRIAAIHPDPVEGAIYAVDYDGLVTKLSGTAGEIR